MRILVWMWIAAVAGLAACVPALETVDTPGTYQTTVIPDVGSTTEIQVGETLIDEKHAITTSAIRFTAPCKCSLKHDAVGTGIVNYSFSQSEVLPQTSIKNGVPAYCGDVTMDLFGGTQQPLCVAVSGSDLVSFPRSEMILKSDCKVEHTTQTIDGAEALRKEILYDGRSGSTIRLSYREFAQDMARPAFTQELTYDITSDRVVGFRGARFEILSASNSSIRYKVISGF